MSPNFIVSCIYNDNKGFLFYLYATTAVRTNTQRQRTGQGSTIQFVPEKKPWRTQSVPGAKQGNAEETNWQMTETHWGKHTEWQVNDTQVVQGGGDNQRQVEIVLEGEEGEQEGEKNTRRYNDILIWQGIDENRRRGNDPHWKHQWG